MSKKIKDTVVYGWGMINFWKSAEINKIHLKYQKAVSGETAVYVSMRKRTKNGRSSVFWFIRWSINKNCSTINHCLNNKIVLLISTKIVNSTILWGLSSYTSSVNSASNIREIGILLKRANLSCCFLFSFGKFNILISQVKQRFNNILYCFNHYWFSDVHRWGNADIWITMSQSE